MAEEKGMSRRMRRLIEREFRGADKSSYEKKLDKVFRKRSNERKRRGFCLSQAQSIVRILLTHIIVPVFILLFILLVRRTLFYM